MLNLVEIKEMFDKVIVHIDETIEESGMEGNLDYSEYLAKELEDVKAVRETLDEYHNSNLSHQMFIKSMKEIAPSFDINKFMSYVEMIITSDRAEVEKAETQLNKDLNVLQFLQNAKDDAWS